MYYVALAIIGIILLAIVGAFIFSENFRKDVIASEGEASVFGMINVKGVIIILLAGIFCGAFVWILSENSKTTPSTKDNREFISKLRELNNRMANPVKDRFGYHTVLLNNDTIRFTPQQETAYFKSVPPYKSYPTNERHYPFEVTSGCQSLREFWFQIDTIVNMTMYPGCTYDYQLSFGEGNVKYHKSYRIAKTAGGGLDGSIYLLSNPKWNYSYSLMIGLGQPEVKGNVLSGSVQLITILLSSSSVTTERVSGKSNKSKR